MNRISVDTEARLAFSSAVGSGAILFDPARFTPADPMRFDPSFWGDAATAVTAGGRGAAWFIDTGSAHWVLRHYQRGGLVARISKDRYFWAGEAAVRSFAEFRLLSRLISMELPVPVPVAAYYVRQAGTYRAALLMERLPSVRPLAACLDGSAPMSLWQRVGRTLATFHRVGVDHADLNANNILISDAGEVSLIDFDRGSVRGMDGPWRAGNLARLQRSLEKLGGSATTAPWREGWACARAAYEQTGE